MKNLDAQELLPVDYVQNFITQRFTLVTSVRQKASGVNTLLLFAQTAEELTQQTISNAKLILLLLEIQTKEQL